MCTGDRARAIRGVPTESKSAPPTRRKRDRSPSPDLLREEPADDTRTGGAVLYPCAYLGCRIHHESIVVAAEEVQTVVLPIAPSAADPEVCDVCHRGHLRQKLAPRNGRPGVPCHSDVPAKRRQRQWMIDAVRNHPALETGAFVFLDAPLPTLTDEAATSLFSEDLLAALGGRVRPHQLFTTNIDPAVVAAQQALGVVHALCMCACLYLQRCSSLIRDKYGGIVLLWPDVWGSFGPGAGRVLEISVRLRLLEPSAGCTIACATSDRHACSRGRAAIESYTEIERRGLQILNAGITGSDGGAGMGGFVALPDPQADLPLRYRTMQVHSWVWRPLR